MNLLLICASGISSSLVKSRMEQYARTNGIDLQITADNEDNLSYRIPDFDIVLVAPQLSHHYDRLTSAYAGTGKIFGLIPMKDYGLANGRNLVEFALKLYEEKFVNGAYSFEDEMLQMISIAGAARRYAFEALTYLEKKQYYKAAQSVKAGKKELINAHQIQASVIAAQMDPDSRIAVNVTLLMVHAQDQISSAETALDIAEHMIRILERM